MEQSKISEELVTLAQVVGESEVLRHWFLSLGPLPPSARAVACNDLATRMRADDEEAGLVSAVCSLARPDIYNAVLQTIK